MRIASFNVENLFQRAIALNLPTWEEGRKTLELQAEINQLFNRPAYSENDKARMVEILGALGLAKNDEGGKFALLRQNRGRLLARSAAGGIEIVANGRTGWVGWVELKIQPVDERATLHTAMVMRDIDPDILGVVEAESRPALKAFSEILLPKIDGVAFDQVMLVDGNDDRGIDVGILATRGCRIEEIRSHVYDTDGHGVIFSRDCPEYWVTTPTGERVVVLVNHLKSKGFGAPQDSNAKRRRQAERIAAIYQKLRDANETNLVVLGDFNDIPDSAALAPLLTQTDLRDISTHPRFVSDGRPGTFGNGAKSDKIDYILLAPALFDRVTGGGVFRKGVWGGTHGTLWEHYPTMESSVQAASDHAAIFADIDL